VAQFGSQTLITKRTRLIILDCFDTLVELREAGYQARKGVMPFLRYYALQCGIPLVVHSDGEAAHVDRALREADVADFFQTVYDVSACEQDSDGRMIKRLDIPLRDFQLHQDQAVFIGDSRIDALAAKIHHLPFIRVPRGEDEQFSFARLIGGSSRYDSGEFTDSFLRHWRK